MHSEGAFFSKRLLDVGHKILTTGLIGITIVSSAAVGYGLYRIIYVMPVEAPLLANPIIVPEPQALHDSSDSSSQETPKLQ